MSSVFRMGDRVSRRVFIPGTHRTTKLYGVVGNHVPGYNVLVNWCDGQVSYSPIGELNHELPPNAPPTLMPKGSEAYAELVKPRAKRRRNKLEMLIGQALRYTPARSIIKDPVKGVNQ